jgi:hypothetical protein
MVRASKLSYPHWLFWCDDFMFYFQDIHTCSNRGSPFWKLGLAAFANAVYDFEPDMIHEILCS